MKIAIARCSTYAIRRLNRNRKNHRPTRAAETNSLRITTVLDSDAA
jgi:hypothetical protein